MAGVRGGDKVRAALEAVVAKLTSASEVRIGFLEGATYPDGTSVPLVAAVQEFGSAKVPPRPYFRNMVRAKSPGWGAGIAAQLEATGNDARAALTITGQAIKEQLQQSINEYDAGPPLSPKTIAKKGFDKQLIDTAHMLNSVDYEVK